MSNQWLRLWHDMPNDPKWRTIARSSGKPIHLVIAVYVHLLVDASRNVTRGHVTVTAEDLASALDVTEEDINAVLHAMQGRVMAGDHLSGWDARQVKREDEGNPETGAKSAAQRKREQREREKAAEEDREKSKRHDESRNVTLDKDKDTDTEVNPPSLRDVPPQDPPKAKKQQGVTLTQWLQAVKEKGERIISDHRPVWDYCSKVGIPADWVELAWLRFSDRYTVDDKARRKRYTDWRRVFQRAVEENWLGLWYWSERDGQFRLSTVGIASDMATREAA